MALNSKDAETDRLARELAALTDESITAAARRALEERLRTVRRQGICVIAVDPSALRAVQLKHPRPIGQQHPSIPASHPAEATRALLGDVCAGQGPFSAPARRSTGGA